MKFAALAWAFFTLGLMAAPAFAADAVYYYSSDTLHSEVVVTDASRNVVEHTYYAPYGQVLNRDLRDGPGYTGHEEDPETNLVYMQQRYYDPEAGRFLSTDPVQADGGGGSFNRYEYADDNPYRYTDPFGMCTGSHISDSHGNCASTGGETTGTNGAVQGMMRAQAQRLAATNTAAQRASAMMRSPSSSPKMLASNSNSGDSVSEDELRNGGAAFAAEIKVLVDEGIIGSKGLGMLTGAAGEVTVAGDTADNWGKTFAGFEGITFQDARSDINWYVNPEGGGRQGPSGIYYQMSLINWGRVDYRPFDPDRKQSPNQIWNNILLGAHLYGDDQK